MQSTRFLILFTVAAAFACGAPRSIAAELSAEEKADGFVSIFDGKSLAGWVGAVDGYEVVEGAIVCVQKKGGNMFFDKDYADFTLKLDAQIPAGGNNGIGVRAPRLSTTVSRDGIEIQVLDDDSPKYAALKPYQYHGSVYGIVPAKRGSLKPAGEWNAHEITVRGRQIKITVNGQTIVDADLDEASTPKTLDQKPHPGLTRTSGYIGFLGHGSRVAFRNIRVKDFSAK